MTSLRTPYKVMLLVLFGLALYYPTMVHGSPNSIDDYKMLMDFQLQEHIDLKQLFIPGASLYYRPLTMLSYLADKALWNLTPSFMLIENILFHLGSGLLLYFIAREIFHREWIAITGALLFIAHPLATESLNWISGRTDPMATFFNLAATLSIVSFKKSNKIILLLGAVFFTCLGILSKEMSVVFAFANALLLSHPWPQKFRWRSFLPTLYFIAPFLCAGILFFVVLLLHGAIPKEISGIFSGHLLGGRGTAVLADLLLAFGFYVKKLFIPIPLNFAIESVSSLYLLVGIFLIPFFFFMVRHYNDTTSFFFLLAILLLVPAFLLSITHTAWTRYADRYAYQALPFFILGLSSALYFVTEKYHVSGEKLLPVIALLVLSASFFTIKRNILWQNKIAFFKETVSLSPTFATVRNELAGAYLDNNNFKLARKNLRKGIELDRQHRSFRNQILYANLAMLRLRHDDDAAGAQKILDEVLKRGRKKASKLILMAQIAILNQQMNSHQDDPGVLRRLADRIIATYKLLYKKTGDLAELYLAGKCALDAGQRQEACSFFATVARKAPPWSSYKAPATTLALKLKHAP